MRTGAEHSQREDLHFPVVLVHHPVGAVRPGDPVLGRDRHDADDARGRPEAALPLRQHHPDREPDPPDPDRRLPDAAPARAEHQRDVVLRGAAHDDQRHGRGTARRHPVGTVHARNGPNLSGNWKIRQGKRSDAPGIRSIELQILNKFERESESERVRVFE